MSSSADETICRVIRKQDFVEKFRSQNLFCDFVIKAENERYNCHRLVLAATVPYFETMFSSAFAEASSGEVEFPAHLSVSMDIVIKYIYTGSIKISVNNVLSIYKLVSYLGINDLADDCDKFINRNFDLISKTNEFLSMECIELLRLIETDRIQANEQCIWEAVLKWVKYDRENRFHNLPKLMEHVKFDLINPTYIWQNIAQDELLTSSTQCKDFIYQVLGNRLTQIDTKESNPSKSRFRRDIYVMGGFLPNMTATDSVLKVDMPALKWLLIQPMIEPRVSFGAVALDKKIFVLGGYKSNNSLYNYNQSRRVFCGLQVFDTDVNKWFELSDLQVKRYELGVCSVDNHIYALGGRDLNQSMLSSVERYDVGRNHWVTIDNQMIEARANLKVVYMMGSIWAIGGSNSCGTSQSVERLDPRVGSWSKCSSMWEPRHNHGAVVLDSKIFVCGGTFVEEYDPRNNKWRRLCPMSYNRSRPSLVNVGGMIWAIGGGTETVEIYDKRKDKWALGTPLPSSLSEHCAVVLP